MHMPLGPVALAVALVPLPHSWLTLELNGPASPECLCHPAPRSLSLPLLSLSPCVPLGPPAPPELLDDQHPVVRLLRSVSSDCTGGRPVSLDAALAHHLHQCSYHLRLFRNWLRSGRDDPECLYGTPAARRAAALPWLGLTALLLALLAGAPTCPRLLSALRLCDLHLVAWMGSGPGCLVAGVLAAHPVPTLLPHCLLMFPIPGAIRFQSSLLPWNLFLSL